MSALFQNRRSYTGRLLPLGLALVLPAVALRAQMHHVDAPERVTRALGVYEWTGELDKPTAARFVPVSLFINGALQDAGLYLARPVPFALQTGDLYSLEHAGEPEGLLDLAYAQHVVTSQALKDDDPEGAWYGYGKFTPDAPVKMVALHPSNRLPVIEANGKPISGEDDKGPHLTRRGDATAPASTTGSGTTKDPSADSAAKADPNAATGTAGSGTGTGAKTDSTDDTDRPTLRHRDPSQDATRRREYGASSKQASVTAVGPGPADDPDRPVLGRSVEADAATPPLTGLPRDMHQAVGVSDPVHRDQHDFARAWETPADRTETMSSLEAVARSRVLPYLAANGLVPSSGPLPSETSVGDTAVAGATSAEATSSKTATATAAARSSAGADDAGTPPRLQRGVPSQYQASGKSSAASPASPPAAASVSQPSTTAPPSAAASPNTSPAASAASRSTARTATNATRHTATHTTPSTAHRSTKAGAHTPATLVLAQGTVTGYTLSYGGLPTFVYVAAAPVTLAKPAPLPSASAGSIAPASTFSVAHPVVFVTVVAQRLPSGELQVALSSVTDSLHLDRSPRLRLIDAVDPDDSHRASLLFELRGASSRQFALYRLTAAQAEQTFTTASIE